MHLPQAILAKAFSGDLVEQNPNDESASELLKKIKEAKKVLNRGTGKKTKTT
jgi:type I restriction enzyme S subunit